MNDFKWNSMTFKTKMTIIVMLLIACVAWWTWPIILQARCESVCAYNEMLDRGLYSLFMNYTYTSSQTRRCAKNCAKNSMSYGFNR